MDSLIVDPPHSAMNRRPDYWKYYHLGHSSDISFMIDTMANLVRGTRTHAKRITTKDGPPFTPRSYPNFMASTMHSYHCSLDGRSVAVLAMTLSV